MLRTFEFHLGKEEGGRGKGAVEETAGEAEEETWGRIALDKDGARREGAGSGGEGKPVSSGYKLAVKGIWQPCIAYEMILTFYYCKVSFLKRNFKCYPAVQEHKNL